MARQQRLVDILEQGILLTAAVSQSANLLRVLPISTWYYIWSGTGRAGFPAVATWVAPSPFF